MTERARIYHERKAARLCVDCRAGLQPADRIRCVECAARAIEDQRRYRRTAQGRRTEAARLRRRYAGRIAAGLCVDCAAQAEPNRRRCAACLADRSVSQAEYMDRTEAA